MRTFAILLLVILTFLACNEQPTATQPEEVTPEAAQTESGEPLGAAITPTYYASYQLVRGAGAITTTGGVWVASKAWQFVPAGTKPTPELFIRDLIVTLDREGILAGVDLTKTKSNWLIVLWPGNAPKKDFVLDSRDMVRAEPAPES